ncbi:MAG TPA: CopD family protein [Blastocatellia bacterium]|nr:CopD family protein [Blastocatellia bacterium]
MYQLSVWIHVLMAAIWVGGLIYTAAVVVPFAVSHETRERQRILRGLGRRFRWIGWISIIVAALTGLGNLMLRPSPVSPAQLLNGEAFDPMKVYGPIAVWLPWKLLLVALMVGLMLYHDVTSLQAARKSEASPDEAPGNRAGSSAAALATLVAIAVLYVSVRLVRG